MPATRWLRRFSARPLLGAWPWLGLLLVLVGLRLSKGALLTDAFALLSRPFWPGTAQAEWLRDARRFEDQARLAQLERDNTAPIEEHEGVQQALVEIYREDPINAPLLERFVDLDEGLQEWRYRHVKMVERTIGMNKPPRQHQLRSDRSAYQPRQEIA